MPKPKSKPPASLREIAARIRPEKATNLAVSRAQQRAEEFGGITAMVAGAIAEPPSDPSKRSSSEEILAALKKAADAVARGKADYLRHRPRLLEVHSALNTRKLVAPAFRPLVAPTKFKGTPTGDQILVDYQLIDMHWLAVTGRDVGTTAQSVIEAIRAEGISAAPASEFARLKWRMKAKVASFEVSPLRQVGCILICADAERRRRSDLMRQARSHARRLKLELEHHSSVNHRSLMRIDIEKVVATWLARELTPGTRATGKPSPQTIAKVIEMILGEETSAHTARHQLNQVARHIDGC